MGVGFTHPTYSNPDHPSRKELIKCTIKAGSQYIYITKNWAILPIGLRYKERMDWREHMVHRERLAIGLLDGYHLFFFDKQWFEITRDGKAKPVEENKMRTHYGEDNAVILNFAGVRFVKEGACLHHLRPVEWRDQKNPNWTKSEFGFFYLEEYAEIKISNNLIIRFDRHGYKEINPIDHKTMVNEIVKKLHDDGVLLEWVSASGSLRALMPDRMIRLGCEELRTCIVRADMITPIHSSRDTVLYKVVKDHWDPMATSFVNNYSNEIERLHHELCKK